MIVESSWTTNSLFTPLFFFVLFFPVRFGFSPSRSVAAFPVQLDRTLENVVEKRNFLSFGPNGPRDSSPIPSARFLLRVFFAAVGRDLR